MKAGIIGNRFYLVFDYKISIFVPDYNHTNIFIYYEYH